MSQNIDKWEKCVLQMKHARGYNPYAVCSARLGRYGGLPTHAVIQTPTGERNIYVMKGRHFYRARGKNVYLD